MKELRIAELRATDPAGKADLILEGTPIVYDQPTLIKEPFGQYTEVIRAGALDGADLSDTRLLYNHDTSKVPLARTPKTMSLNVDPAGLKLRANLPNTEEGRSVHTAVQRGDLSGMSFAFKVAKGGSSYDAKTNTRTITKIEKVYECSVCPFPAYPQTSVEARSAIEGARLSDPARAEAKIKVNQILKKECLIMEFKTVAEAFNFYRNHTIADIEKRAAEIGNLIDTDSNANITALNIELSGLKEAKANIEQRSQTPGTGSSFNPITGMNFNQGQQVPEGDVFASQEYRSAFYKTLLGQKLTDVETKTYARAMDLVDAERRADAFSTTTSAAAVLPAATLNEIISKARTMGGLISNCRDFAIPTNLTVPIATPGAKAAWHVEGAAVEAIDAAAGIAKVSFGAYEILKVFSLSAAAKKMSIQAFEAYITDELTACVMETISDALVNGTGEAQGTGVLSGITWNAGNSFTFLKTGAPVYGDFTKMLAKLKRGYGAGAKWAMNNASLYNLVYSLVDSTGKPIFIADPKNEEIGYILGKVVVIDDNIADDVILLGNFKYMGYNIPQGVMIEVSRDSSFKSGLVDYRAMAIADTKPLVTEAFVKLSRALV